MSNQIFTAITTLIAINCPECGGVYAITESYKNEAARIGDFKQCWTCPYCKTTRGYGEGEADKLRKQIADLEQSKKYLEERKQYSELDAGHFRKSRYGIKGVLTRERNRVGKPRLLHKQNAYVK